MSEWIHCNRGSPCPICQEAKRCSIHRNHDAGFCRTPEANPDIAPRVDRTGQQAWLWTLGTLGERRHSPVVEERICADDALLDAVYSLVLRCGCSEPHLQHLCRRYGVAYERRQSLPLADYCSISRIDVPALLRSAALHAPGEAILSIPGFFKQQTGGYSFVPPTWNREGILIACRNPAGQITALKARFDGERGARYCMVSSSRHGGCSPRLSLHFPDTPQATDSTIRITEGEIKASVATYITEVLTLSLPGVSSWQLLLPVLQQLVRVRRVMLAFDMDAYTNVNVARGLYELAREILACSSTTYTVAVEQWDPAYKGIDDLLIAGGLSTCYEGQDAEELIVQIARQAGLETEEERFAGIVRRVQATTDLRILTEPAVQAFCSSFSATMRYAWDAEMRTALGMEYSATRFWSAVQTAYQGSGPMRRAVLQTGDRLPVIETFSRSTTAITHDAVQAVYAHNDPPRIFYWGNTIARLHQPTHGADFEISVLDTDTLRAELERTAHWQRTQTRNTVQVAVPENTARDLLSYPEVWNGLPRVEGVVSYPVFDNRGRLCDQPGYNPSSGMVFDSQKPLDLFPLPDYVTGQQIQWAVDIINYVLTDFHFVDAASRAYAYALFLLQPARFLISDITPLHAIEAPQAGVGKGKLYSVLTKPWLPKDVARTQAPTNDAEWDKRLLAALTKSSTHLMFDNIGQKLDSDALASALTSRTYSSRILGISRIAEVPVRCIWAVTGNNITASVEIQRRIFKICLGVDVEDPAMRQGFTITDIEKWVVEHRETLITAGLWLVKAWLDRGRPLFSRVAGSYEQWSQIIGGILEVAGIEGFLTDTRSNADSDEKAPWREFIYRWFVMYGTNESRVGALMACADGLDLGLTRDREGMQDTETRRIRLGKAISKMVGTVYSGCKIRFVRNQGGGKVYRLEIIDLEAHEANMQQHAVDDKTRR